MEIYFFYIGLVLFLLSICMAFLLRKYLVRYTISLTSCIDAMLAAKENIEFDEENELLTSKIQVKFRQLYDVLNQQKEASIRDREQLEEIISDISHQIKTPMSNIKMYSDILKNRELTKEKQREFLGLVQLQIDKLESLIDSMIEMSQMEVGMISVLPKRQPLIKLIEEAVCGIAVKAEKKNMDISILCDERLMACYDLKWTTEALVNVLDNAVKYSDENGEIKISVLELGFFIKVQVTDNGKGIEEGNFTQIFKRFYREPEVQQVEGVGIGLFLAQEILKKQKGYVDVKSSPGRGSTFSLYLPFGE
ncbi:MAG: HAMP domain-containing histidine kinase [Lachnospiraceae bacterium]|nr:HAMP domain-containing histidine kinase [Lachnospiraceae bacterium]